VEFSKLIKSQDSHLGNDVESPSQSSERSSDVLYLAGKKVELLEGNMLICNDKNKVLETRNAELEGLCKQMSAGMCTCVCMSTCMSHVTHMNGYVAHFD